MEAFVRFKKCQDGLFLSLVRPDFNVLPLIEWHFKARYQDQSWLIYDEKRNYGIYYDLQKVHQVEMNAYEVDVKLATGFSQSFSVELDEQEWLYDQLWKDYFRSVNIEARQNMKLHIQYVPKRYWRYMNEKSI
jgi:probable DNA metabolism protein